MNIVDRLNDFHNSTMKSCIEIVEFLEENIDGVLELYSSGSMNINGWETYSINEILNVGLTSSKQDLRRINKIKKRSSNVSQILENELVCIEDLFDFDSFSNVDRRGIHGNEFDLEMLKEDTLNKKCGGDRFLLLMDFVCEVKKWSILYEEYSNLVSTANNQSKGLKTFKAYSNSQRKVLEAIYTRLQGIEYLDKETTKEDFLNVFCNGIYVEELKSKIIWKHTIVDLKYLVKKLLREDIIKWSGNSTKTPKWEIISKVVLRGDNTITVSTINKSRKKEKDSKIDKIFEEVDR